MNKIVLLCISVIIFSCKNDDSIQLEITEPSVLFKSIIDKNDSLMSLYFDENYKTQQKKCDSIDTNIVEIVELYKDWYEEGLKVFLKQDRKAQKRHFPYFSDSEPKYIGIQNEIPIYYLTISDTVSESEFNDGILNSLMRREDKDSSYFHPACIEKSLNVEKDVNLYSVSETEKNIINKFVYNGYGYGCFYNIVGKVGCRDSLSKYYWVSEYLNLLPYHDGGGFEAESSVVYVNRIISLETTNASYVIIEYRTWNTFSNGDVYKKTGPKSFEKIIHIKGVVI